MVIKEKRKIGISPVFVLKLGARHIGFLLKSFKSGSLQRWIQFIRIGHNLRSQQTIKCSWACQPRNRYVAMVRESEVEMAAMAAVSTLRARTHISFFDHIYLNNWDLNLCGFCVHIPEANLVRTLQLTFDLFVRRRVLKMIGKTIYLWLKYQFIQRYPQVHDSASEN